ncbi:MAG: polysaccharide deacetylase family protein [Butyricicoccus pullicaecorum]|nr:polysaccharide deacetylase family protein [Butyricicoccus pullicaecorum]
MEQTGMKRLLCQMLATVMVLGGLFAWNTRKEAVSVLAQEQVDLPVLMYHSILKDEARANAYVLSPETLAADLDYLKQHGYETVTIAQLVDYVDGQGELPDKPVLITFDDGFYNNYLYAYPLLQEREMCAVISPIGRESVLFTENEQENAYWSYLSMGRLMEMQESGVFEIANHSYQMHADDVRKGCLKKRGEQPDAYEALLESDTRQAQTVLAESGLTPPLCYTYPFGAYSQETERVMKKLGFRCTLSCEERHNVITRNPECLYLLGRYNRPSGIATDTFFEKMLCEEAKK